MLGAIRPELLPGYDINKEVEKEKSQDWCLTAEDATIVPVKNVTATFWGTCLS